MQLSELVRRLDDRLDTDAYAGVDASANGLQVGPDGRGTRRDPTVERAALAVDAAVATAEAAADAGADLLVAHHGLSWGGIERVTGRTHDRIAALIRNGVALYVSHLPLDGHPELGNAAGVADLLGIKRRSPLGDVGGETIGLRGTIPDGRPVAELTTALDRDLDTGAAGVRALGFGPDRRDARYLALPVGPAIDGVRALFNAVLDEVRRLFGRDVNIVADAERDSLDADRAALALEESLDQVAQRRLWIRLCRGICSRCHG